MAYDEKFFAEATSAQLKEFRRTIDMENADPTQVVQLDELINERTVKEMVTGELTRAKQTERAKTLDKKAYTMWPELKDEKSDFYAAVNEYMKQNGEDAPDSMLNAANAVGLDQGLSPAGRTPSKGSPMESIKGSEHGDDSRPKGDEFFKKTSKIAKAFGDMIDLSDEKVRERIAERAEENTDG